MFIIELFFYFFDPLNRAISNEVSSWKKNGADRQVIRAGIILGSLTTIFIVASDNTIGFIPNGFICIGAIVSIISGIIGAIIGKHWKKNRIVIWAMAMLFI